MCTDDYLGRKRKMHFRSALLASIESDRMIEPDNFTGQQHILETEI